MKHVAAENLVVIVELKVRQDQIDAFLDYTVENLSISRAYPGNVEFHILVDETEPRQVIFYEVWESAEAQQAYMGWRTQAGDLTTLMAFLAAEPKFTALRRIAAGPHPRR